MPTTNVPPDYPERTENGAPYMPASLYALLEVIHECIVDSGVPYKTLRQKRTGTYLAMTFNDEDAVTTSTSSESSYLNTKSEFPGRIASSFGFHGPAASVDTACSSSISALQMAILDLTVGRSDYAIVAAGVHYASEESQIKLLSELYNGEDVVYVEADGTGIKVNDAMEVSALAEVFCKNRTSPLLVGSCKSNLGHTEACSGLVSLLKCVMSIQHSIIPPNVCYNQPIPEIAEIMKHQLKIVTEPTKLPSGKIGINCFGFGGTIGHVILQRCEKIPKKLSNAVLIPLCIQDNKQYNKLLDFTALHARRPEVLTFLSSSFFSQPSQDAHATYISVISNEIKMRTTAEKRTVPVWLVFHDGLFMNRNMVNKDLLNIDYFQQSFHRYDTILNSLGYETSLTQLLSEVYSTFRERLLLSTALLMAYVDILKLCDFQPDMICGYGLAEIVVAYYDGCINQDQCLKIAYMIGTYFTSSDNEDKKEIDLEIRLPTSAKFRLPNQATLIAALNEDTFYIRVPHDCLETVNKIGLLGGFLHWI
eukprot:XP_014775589.1 PREDICTED: fatty acid synthase-like [Octopus bimaculoides]